MKCVPNINPRKKTVMNKGVKNPQIGQNAITKENKQTTPRNVAVGIILGQ